MKLKTITAPASEPVTATEAKSALSIDGSDRDTQVTAAIVAARELVEEYTGRALITQTLELAVDELPGRMPLELPRAPLASVTSATWYDDDASGTVVDSGEYHVDTYAEPGAIVLRNDGSWPEGDMRPVNGLVVRYVAGYGLTAATVPRALREAIIETVRAMIDGEDWTGLLPPVARNMARNYRIPPV